jgi:hypothetical protein
MKPGRLQSEIDLKMTSELQTSASRIYSTGSAGDKEDADLGVALGMLKYSSLSYGVKCI